MVQGRADDPGGFHIHYFKQRRELTLDPAGRLAVRFSDAADPLRADLAPVIAPERLEPMVIKGWNLLGAPVAEAQRPFIDRRELAQRIAEASQDPRIDFVSPVFVDAFGGPLVVTPDLLVGFTPEATPQQIAEILANEGLDVLVEADWGRMPGVYRVRGLSRSGLEVLDAANRLATLDQVRFAEPDMMFTGLGDLFPNDPGFSSCWGIHNTGQFSGVVDRDMDGPEAWDVSIGNPGIGVLIIDTGVQQDHPDINQVAGADLTSEGPGFGGPVNSFDNHGTAVAGCVSATINNGLGTVGIAPGCVSVSARTFISINAQGNWNSVASWTVNALTFGENVGCRVSNNSNGYGFTSSAIANKYNTSRNGGMVHFASAGNNGTTTIGYPANLPTVNAVAALTPTGALASFSDRGVGLAFSAPGTSVYSTDRTGSAGYSGNDYAFVQGTSFASPYTAGVAALVLSKNAVLSAVEVEDILEATCVDLGDAGYDTNFGWGFVNAAAALAATPTPDAPSPFELLGPSNFATNVPRQPVFTWQAASSAPVYTFILDNDADLSSPLVQTETVLTTHSLSAPLSAGTTYYWSVIATNELGSTDSTPAVASFSTISIPPLPFAMTAPENGAIDAPVQPTLRWDAATHAESYTVIVDDNADLSSPAIQLVTTLTQFTPGSPLFGNTTYYWTVIANNPIGGTPASTGVWSFQTVVALPGSFNLVSPADGPTISDSTPTLVWTASGGADSYTVIVDDDLAFTSPAVHETGITTTSFDVPAGALTSGLRYYWKVSAVNAAGATPSTPLIFSFGLIVPPCYGDADGSRFVDFADISTVLAYWLTEYPEGPGPGDANRDGKVDFVDISNVLSNWGTDCDQ